MIGILDYGAGNLGSVSYTFQRIKAQSRIVKTPDELSQCSGLVIPGVGAFRTGMAGLKPMKKAIIKFAKSGKPLLGICLGMQVLFQKGTEGGNTAGLGLIEGTVEKIAAPKLPHVGWNQVKQVKPSKLFVGINDNSYFYFVHSYVCKPKKLASIAGSAEFYGKVTSAVEQDNIFGVQFHPEKSGEAGERMLKNFWRTVENGSYTRD